MSNKKSKLFNFFFPDGYKIAINIITLFGLILFILVMHATLKKKSKKFHFLFIIMINVMISSILSPLGYLLNWKINTENSTEKKLLFGESNGFLCQSQSFILAFFQSSRETFLTLLTTLVFINYIKQNNKIINKLFFKNIIVFIGYGIPFIANLIYSLVGAFGESHLFCFTKLDTSGSTTICGTIHFGYIFFLLILSFFFTLYIIIKDYCNKDYDPWTDDDKEKEKGCLNSELKKIIFYPFAQIFSMSFIFYYRFRDYFTSEGINGTTVAGICAIINAISSVLYTCIFILSNNLFCRKNNNESEEHKDIRLLTINIDDESDESVEL